jgi:hypothetical protein
VVSALAALALLAFAPLSVARTVISGFATEPTPVNDLNPVLGGQIRYPGAIAVNDSGAGAAKGTIYALDRQGRVNRFSPTGAWQRGWGWDVITTSFDEDQEFRVDATGGTFTLGFKGVFTDPIPFDYSMKEVMVALRKLSTIGGPVEGREPPAEGETPLNLGNSAGTPQNQSCGEVRCVFRFLSDLAATDVPPITVDTSELEGTAEVITLVNGVDAAATGGAATGFEICTVAAHCKRPEEHPPATGNGGAFPSPGGLAVNQANGHVYVTDGYLEHRVTEFDADGNFIRAWGWDVIASGEPGDTGTGFEICEAAGECQAGAPGASGGQFADLGEPIGRPVTDPANNVWVPEPANRRIQEFDSTGHFIAAYGYDVDALGGSGALEECTSLVAGACQAGAQGSDPGQFAADGPTEIAFDNLGNLYAIDPGNSRVQKFDPTLLASASAFAAPLFATYTTGAPGHILATQGGTRLVFSLNRNVSPSLPVEHQVIEVDPASPTSALDTSLAGVGLTEVNGQPPVAGLAADPGSANLYMTTAAPIAPNRILVLGPVPGAITVSLSAITAKTDSTATLSGGVDPKGAWASDCRFQYSTDQEHWTAVPVSACESFGGSAGAVSAKVVGLDPNTTYFVRLQASRPLTAGSTVTSVTKSFHTDSPPPVISDTGAIQASDRSVRLVTTIDPRNTETGYVFQYGTTPALGSSTEPLEIGSGTTPLILSQVVSGLVPDTTYYFRVSATNLAGTTTGSSQSFHTRATPLPSAGDRAWEMVTLPEKNFYDANGGAFGLYEASVATGGDAVGYCTTALFGEPPGRMSQSCAPYISRRTPNGWQTPADFPEYCHVDPITGDEDGRLTVFPSPDYSRYLFSKSESKGCPVPPLDPAAPMNPSYFSRNFYLRDATGSAYQLLNPNTRTTGRGDYQWNSQRYEGGSDDFGHVVFRSNVNQTAAPEDSPPEGDFRKLYDWTRQGEPGCAQPGGCLELASRGPDDKPFETDSSIAAIQRGVNVQQLPSAVSADGERIFFSNPINPTAPSDDPSVPVLCNTAGCDLYMREGGATTHDVSESECTAECGPGSPDILRYATPSGEKAFFSSCAKLTDASSFDQASCSGPNLYRWDLNAPPGHHLVDLTTDHEPSDGLDSGFLGLIGASDDGDTAFFVTAKQIVAGQPTTPVVLSGNFNGTINNAKLYRWRWNGGDPSVDYLGPYQSLDGRWGVELNLSGYLREVTPSGGDVMIFSRLRIDPAADHDGDADIYRWDSEEGWTCVSCQAPGAPSGGDVDMEQIELSISGLSFEEILSYEAENFISDDGKRIAFGTPDALVPEDVNGEAGCPLDNVFLATNWPSKFYACEDAYEWHEGTVSLLSSGTGSSAVRLIGSSLSGNDVFFWTRQPLVGWDRGEDTDVYDARVGGGFPEPPAQPPGCEGAEQCHLAGTATPAASGAGTAVFQGPGNPAPKHKGAPKPRKHKKHHKRHGRAAKQRHDRAAKHNRRAGR